MNRKEYQRKLKEERKKENREKLNTTLTVLNILSIIYNLFKEIK